MALRGGIGLSTPNDLLTYVDKPGAPAYCRTPESLLAALEQSIMSDQSKTGAAATLQEGPTLRIVSPLGSAGACRNEYVAELWTEGETGSSSDYKVRAFGRVRQVCPRRVYRLDDLVGLDAARHVDVKLMTIFQRCR
jgi:hypothetical protein